MCLDLVGWTQDDSPPHIGVFNRFRARLLRKRRRGTYQEGKLEGERDFFDHSHQAAMKMAHVLPNERQMTLDRLLHMTPLINGVDLVGRTARQLFLSHLKSQPSVMETFFPTHERDTRENNIDADWFDFDEFATLFVCYAITKCRDTYKIYKMLDQDRTEELMMEYFNSPYWKKIGFSLYTQLYPDLVRDQDSLIPFRSYMKDDGRFWAEKICERMRDTKWLHSIVKPSTSTNKKNSEKKYNREINDLFVKIHLLDPSLVFPAYDNLRKAMPDLNLELVTTNYLGEPLDWKLIKHEIIEALSKPTFPRNTPKISVEEYELYFGVQVTEFVMQDAKEIGLWSGQYPDNKRKSTFKDRCSIM